jgi:NSS family neurotransmitter:Na+ symporter
MVPMLFILIIILDIQALTLPGGMEGFKFLFKPDFSKINSKVVLGALGHAFYSLSLGMGIMITYGSYMSGDEDLGKTALQISIADTLIALLAGLAIFPAVFSYGVDPTSGAGLVFMTLPNVFPKMPGGYFFGIMFFVLLALAALTSTISLLEVVVAFLVDSFNMNRKKAAVLSTIVITIVGILASLANGPLSGFLIFGDNIFDFLDKTTANYFLTTAALISVVFIGWFFSQDRVSDQITNKGSLEVRYSNIFSSVVKYVLPVGIILVFLYQMEVFGQI